MAEEILNNQGNAMSNQTPVTNESQNVAPEQNIVDINTPNGDLFSGIFNQNQDNPKDDNYVKLNYEKIKDNLFTDQTFESIASSQLDASYMSNLEKASNFINTSLTPTFTSPLEALDKANDNAGENILNTSIFNTAQKPVQDSDYLNPSNVAQFGFKSSNFDRFYNHTNFSELGFHPYRNNDAYYNENSSWWDDHKRMWGQFGQVFGTGFTSTYDAIGDMFSSDGYLQAETHGADNFAEAMRVGNTTRGGVGGFATNLLLNAGYTVGILSSIAVEELALAALEAGTFGGATPIVASRTAYNIVRLGRVTDKVADSKRASEALVASFKNADEVKSFWNSAGRFTGSILTPNTREALKTWKTVQNTAQSLSTMAKTAKTAGGLYRDFRMMNLAMAESKLEAGMVKNDTFSELYSRHVREFGDGPDMEQLKEMQNAANNGAFTATMWNFPVIFLSNHIVFGTALKGFRGTAALLNATKKGISKQIGKTSTRQVRKGAVDGFVDLGESATRRFINRGFGKNLAVFGGSLLRYTAPNSVEGFQEIIQEGVAVGVKDYYTKLYDDPMAAGLDAQYASIWQGAKSQWSHQGFEVFMSGFLMGGLVQGPQKWVMEDGPKFYQKMTDPKGYAEYKKQTQDYINQTVKTLNEVYNDPKAVWDPIRINALNQKILNENLFVSSTTNNKKSFVDTQDASLFKQIHTVMQSGKAYEFRTQLEDFLKLDETMLAEAFPESTAEELKSGKIRKRITSMLSNLNEQEKAYKELNDIIVNPHSTDNMIPGSAEYVEESIKFETVQHAKMLALYTRKTFQRALERSNSIRQELSSNPIIAKISSRDIDSLTNLQDLISEIDLLKTTIRVAASVEGDVTDEQKLLNSKNQEKLSLLQDYFSVLTDSKNIESREDIDIQVDDENAETKGVQQILVEGVRRTILGTESLDLTSDDYIAVEEQAHPFGIFNAEKIDELEKSVSNYLKFIANNEDDFIDHDALKETLIKIVDFKALKGRAQDYNKAIQYIMSPNRLNELAEGFVVKFREFYIENKKNLRSRMEKYVDQTEKSNFLNAIAKDNVYPVASETEQWLKGVGQMPTVFLIEDRVLNPISDKAIYGRVEHAVGIYNNLARTSDANLNVENKDNEFEDSQSDEYSYDENFEQPQINEEDGLVADDNFDAGVSLGKQYLSKKYREYQNNTTGVTKTYMDWREDPVSKPARIVAKAIIKLNQEIYLPLLLEGVETDSFAEWLPKNEEVDEVQNILRLYDVTVKDITGQNSKKNTELGARDSKSKSHPSGVTIKETVIIKEGQEATMYSHVDENNNSIDDDVYGSEDLAKSARDKKVRATKNDASYDFAKKRLKSGMIIINKVTNSKFMIKSKKKQVDTYNNLWVVPANDTNGKKKIITASEFVKDYTVVTDEIIQDNVKVAKLLAREPLGIVPVYDVSIKDKAKRITDMNDNLQAKLAKLSKTEQETLNIKIRRGPYWDNRNQDVDALASYTFQDDVPNTRIKLQKQKLWIEIMNGDETIGFFQGTSTSVLLSTTLDAKGKPEIIDPLSITKQQANDLFRRFKKKNGKGYTTTIENLVSQIKHNYTQAIAIEETLEALFNNSGKDELTISVSDLQEIGINLSDGEFDYVEDYENGASGVTFGELDHMFVTQEKNNEDVTLDGKRPYYVMDYSRNYPSFKMVKGKKVFERIKGLPITNIDTSKPGGGRLNTQINEIFNLQESKSKNLKGKYIALVSMPNGKYALVKLKPDTMQPEAVDDLLNSMKERSKDTFENHKGSIEYNDLWNQELNSGSPANSPYELPGVFIAAGEGVFITLSVNSVGGLNVGLRDFGVAVGNDMHRQTAYLDYDVLQGMNNAEDLIKALSSENFPKFKPTMNSFKNTIAINGIDLNVLSLASTQLNPEVKKGFFLTMAVSGEGASAILNPIIRRSTQQKKQDEMNKLDAEKIPEEIILTEEEKIERNNQIILNDYTDVSPAMLRAIAEKMFMGDPLDEIEKLIYNARLEDVNAYRLELVTNNIPDVSTKSELEYQQNLNKVDIAEGKLRKHIKLLRSNFTERLTQDSLYDPNTSDGLVALNRELRRLTNQDPIVIQMRSDIEKLNAEGNIIFKVTKDFDGNDIEDIDTYAQYIRDTLPTTITLTVDDIANRMKDTFTTVGYFQLAQSMVSEGIEGIRGTISVGTNSPFKYHEAFHAVYRMLLTDTEISKYNSIARKELRALYRTEKGYEIEKGTFIKSEAAGLEFLRSIHAGYAQMNTTELSEILVEEYIADRFDEFKSNPSNTKTSPEIKSMFTKIIDFIKAIFGQFKADKASQLNSLFKSIDSGKYKRAGTVSNKFTGNLTENNPIFALKKSIRLGYVNLKYKNEAGNLLKKKVSNVMPIDQQMDIIGGAANLYRSKIKRGGTLNKIQVLEEAVIMTIEMYNPDRKFYNLKSEQWHLENSENLENIYYHLNLQVDLITDLVNDRLADISQKVDLENAEVEELEADGVRTTEQYGKSADEIGGIGAMLDPNLRDYMATTTINEKDIFENEFFDDNKTEPFVIGIDVHDAYNGILKAVANEFDELKIIQKAWIYSRKNPNSKAFMDRFFEDVGLLNDAIGVDNNAPILFNDDYLLSDITDSSLYQMFVNGFENSRTDNMFIQYDSSGIAHLFSATKKDDAHHTVSQWANKFNRKYRNIKIAGSEARTKAIDSLVLLKQALESKDASTVDFNKISVSLNDNLGMDMSPLYIEYSVLSSAFDQSNFTSEQLLLLDTFSSTEILTVDDLNKITHSINLGENIFLDVQTTKTNTKVAGGVKNRLMTIALNNAPFSESVGATVFKDPEGNLIFAHQMPTYHLVELSKMKGVDWVANKILESPFMKDNVLLTDPTFRAMVEQNKIQGLRITGSKNAGQLSVNELGVIGENKALSVNQKPGTKYGEGTPKQFVLNLIHAYLYYYNNSAPNNSDIVEYIDESGLNKVKFAMAPNLIRVIEASNTGDLVSGPVNAQVIETEEGTRLTDRAVEKRKTVIKQSFERAQREANPETRTPDLIYLGNTDRFNNRTDRGRLTRLDDVAELTNSLRQRQNRAVSINLPNVYGELLTNIGNQNVKTILRESESTGVSNLSANTNGVVDVNGAQFVMFNKGAKKFTDLTNEDQAKLLEDMGTSILTEDQYNNRKTGSREMWSFKIGSKRFYTYVFSDIKYFYGDTVKTIFSFVPLSEQSEVAVGLSTQQIVVKTLEELKTKAEQANEQGNNQLARILLDKIEEVKSENYTEGVLDFEVNTAETMDIDTSIVDGLMGVIESAREGTIIPFEDAWNGLGSNVGDNAIRTRAMQDVNEHIILLKEAGAYDEISTNISDGLGLVQNQVNSKKLDKVINPAADLMMELYNLKRGQTDFNLAQIFLNDHINTIGINHILLGDTAMSLKDSVDAIKRAKMQNAAGKNASSLIHDNEQGVLHSVDRITQLLFQDELVNREFETIIEADRAKEGTQGERTDGQMYITLKALRYFLFGFGELTIAKAEILNKIAAGEKVEIDNEIFGSLIKPSYKKQGLMLNSMKLAYGDGKTYLKMSAAILTPELTSYKRNGEWVARTGRTALHNLRTKLENYENQQWEKGIGTLGIAVPASASKMMKVNMQTTDAAFGDGIINDDMVSTLEAKHMRLQVVNPSNKIETVDPRQIKNLITSEHSDNVTVSMGGTELTIGQVKAMYHKYSSSRVTNEYFKRRNLIFTFSGAQNEMIKAQNAGNRMSVNLTAFLKYAIKGLEASDTKAQMMDYFSMDEFGEPNYNLNNQLTVGKFQQLFSSFFSKGVIAEKQPGISAALMSDAGFKVVKKVQAVDSNGVPTKWVVIRSEDWEGMKSIDENLTVVEYTDSRAETFSGLKVNDFYLDHLRSNVMGYNKDGTETGVRHTEMMVAPHFKAILDNIIAAGEPIPEAIAKMFGIRIPSQDKHSAVNLMVVDWLPTYMGSTAVFSRDLVEISGADFDIDKLYMHIKDFYVKNGEFIEYGSATNSKEGYEDYIRYSLKEYGKKDTSLYMAVEEFLRREKSIENAERIGIDKNTASMSTFEKNEFMKKYLSDKEFKIKVELFDILSQDDKLSVAAAEKLFNRAEGLAEALKMLSLPVTFTEYNTYREENKVEIKGETVYVEPYKGALDNQILDTKFALLGNSGMTDPKNNRITGIASEPAVLTPLTDDKAVGLLGEGVWQYIQRELPELALQVNEEGIDINNFNGKMLSWDNNKEGARSIGAVVRPNLLISILQEHGVVLRSKVIKGLETFPRLELNGGKNKHNKFGIEYTINPVTGLEDSTLHRKQFVISALVTAMTDNAKERLAKKLGLTKSSLGVVTTMLALGVDIKTTVLLIKHPTIANAFDQAKVKSSSAKGILSLRKAKLQAALSNRKNKVEGLSVGIESLTSMNKYFNSIKDGVAKLDRSIDAEDVGIGDPENNIEGWSTEELQYDLKVIEQYLTASSISDLMMNMSELVDIQKGPGSDLVKRKNKQKAAVELGLTLSEEEFEKTSIPINVRGIFLKQDNIQAANYSIFRDIYDNLDPATFIQRTELFEKLYETLLTNLNSQVYFTKGMEAKLSKDLIGYLSTKHYVNKIENDSFQNWQLASLNNQFIYDATIFPQTVVESADGRKVNNNSITVTDVVNELNAYVGEDNSNYFLKNYISVIETDSENNNSGQIIVEANTWTNVNDAELTRIQNSVLELYQDPNTHKNIVHLINYLLVKDGFQYGQNTFMSAIPADLTKDILNSITPVFNLFKGNDENSPNFNKVFGMSYRNLFNDFIEGYMSSSRMDYYLNSTKSDAEISLYKLREIEKPTGSILIDFELAEDSTNTQVLSNLAARPLTYKGRDYGSVIHAFQTLRSGNFNEKVNKAYMKEGISKAFGAVIENKAKMIRGTNIDILLKQIIKASFMQEDTDFAVNGISIRKELILHADFEFMTNDKITKATREGLLAVQKDMVYNVKEDGSMTIISKAGVNAQTSKNAVLINNPIVRNTVEKTLTIDAHKGVDSSYTDKVKRPAPVYNVSKIKKGEVSPRAKYNKNLKSIVKDGKFLVAKKKFNIKGKDVLIDQIVFPYIIKNSIGRSNTKYYKLVKFYPDGAMPIDVDAYEMMNSDDKIALGSRANYVEISQFGSMYQNAGGFALPGNIPTKEAIDTYIDKKKSIFASEENVQYEENYEDVQLEEENKPEGQEFFNEEPVIDLSEDSSVDGLAFLSTENTPELTSSIASQAKAVPSDDKVTAAWIKFTADERLGAANVFKIYNAEDLIVKYNSTNNIAPISVSKFMENLKCGF